MVHVCKKKDLSKVTVVIGNVQLLRTSYFRAKVEQKLQKFSFSLISNQRRLCYNIIVTLPFKKNRFIIFYRVPAILTHTRSNM